MSKNANKFANTTGTTSTTGAAASQNQATSNSGVKLDELSKRIAAYLKSMIDGMTAKAFEYFDNLSDDEFLKMCAHIKEEPSNASKIFMGDRSIDISDPADAMACQYMLETYIDHFDGERKTVFTKATADIMKLLQDTSFPKPVSMTEKFDEMIASGKKAEISTTDLEERFAAFTGSSEKCSSTDSEILLTMMENAGRASDYKMFDEIINGARSAGATAEQLMELNKRFAVAQYRKLNG